MAFYGTLVALDWSFGDIASLAKSVEAWTARRYKHPAAWSISVLIYYQDLVAIISRNEFKQMAAKSTMLMTWFNKLPSSVRFIIVHEAEWESGMGD